MSRHIDETTLKEILPPLLPYLNERDRRLVVASLAKGMGRGGAYVISRATGLSCSVVYRGLQELEDGSIVTGRLRRPSRGGQKLADMNPELVQTLEGLIEAERGTEPAGPLKWSCRSTRELAESLSNADHPIAGETLRTLLHDLGYRLATSFKCLEETNREARDAQMRYLNAQVNSFLSNDAPVLIVTLTKSDKPRKDAGPSPHEEVRFGHYPSDLQPLDAAAATFQAGLTLWWRHTGCVRFGRRDRLLVCCDFGGMNGRWLPLWRQVLQSVANATGITITVSHIPQVIRKWLHIGYYWYVIMGMNGEPGTATQHTYGIQEVARGSENSIANPGTPPRNHHVPSSGWVMMEPGTDVNMHAHEFNGRRNYDIVPEMTHGC